MSESEEQVSESVKDENTQEGPFENVSRGFDSAHGTVKRLLSRFLKRNKSSSGRSRSVRIAVRGKQSKIDTKALERSIRDTFLLSRYYSGDLSVFVETMDLLRDILDMSRSSPKFLQDCELGINKAQEAQKKIMSITPRYEAMLEHFEDQPKPKVMAETINFELLKVFDLCNVLIQKLHTLESVLGKR